MRRIVVENVSKLCRMCVETVSNVCRNCVEYVSKLCRMCIDTKSHICRMWCDGVSKLCRNCVEYMLIYLLISILDQWSDKFYLPNHRYTAQAQIYLPKPEPMVRTILHAQSWPKQRSTCLKLRCGTPKDGGRCGTPKDGERPKMVDDIPTSRTAQRLRRRAPGRRQDKHNARWDEVGGVGGEGCEGGPDPPDLLQAPNTVEERP